MSELLLAGICVVPSETPSQLQLLNLSKRQGGVGLLDVWAYYRVNYLTRLVYWHYHVETKHWVLMELEDSSSTMKSCPGSPSSCPKISVPILPLVAL